MSTKSTETPVKSSAIPKKEEGEKIKCGIVMPISASEGYSEKHWQEVFTIVSTVVKGAGFDPNMVSDSDEVGIIQKRIIQNLYHNPIVVCDVSGKNANVMFELGIRLAFDKPTIIIKDNVTPFSFDTAQIEHLQYPKDLHYPSMVEFQQKLRDKVINTLKASADPQYTTFLKHFGEFKVAEIPSTNVSPDEYVMKELAGIKDFMTKLSQQMTIANTFAYVPESLNRTTKHRFYGGGEAEKMPTVLDRYEEHLSKLIDQSDLEKKINL